jgi:hypothetical protein
MEPPQLPTNLDASVAALLWSPGQAGRRRMTSKSSHDRSNDLIEAAAASTTIALGRFLERGKLAGQHRVFHEMTGALT